MNDIEQKQNKSGILDALLMVGLVFSLFTMLCLLTREALLGEFGEVYANFVLGGLGFSAYGGMPILACFCIFQLFSKKSINSLMIFASCMLYVIGATFIFHILTSSASGVYSGSVSYAEYINESYYLTASGFYNATAGGAVASAILYYILKSVGVVGANIFSVAIILLASFGLWLVIRKVMPKNAKMPKTKKEKQPKKPKQKRSIKISKEQEEFEDEFLEEYEGYHPEEEYYEEELKPQKRYNKLGMEIINPTEEERYDQPAKVMPRFNSSQTERRKVQEEKTSKLHVFNIEEPTQDKKRGKKSNSAQDVLFNGQGLKEHTIASHNMVRHLGDMNRGEESKFDSSIPISQNQQMMDIFATYKPTINPNGLGLNNNSNDYNFNPTSEFGLFDTGVTPQKSFTPEAKVQTSATIDPILQPFKTDGEQTKAMYDKRMPVNPPKIWTMADIQEEKPKAEEVIEEIAEEIIEEEVVTQTRFLTEEERLQEAERAHRERMEKLKSEMFSPADQSDIRKLQEIYPSAPTKEVKPVVNPRIISSLSQLTGEEEKPKQEEKPAVSQGESFNKSNFVYDTKTDEFIDRELDRQLDQFASPKKEVKQAEVSNNFAIPMGFTKTEFSPSKPDEIYTRQNIANPKIISNPDGLKGEQLPIYAEEKLQFDHPYIYPPIELLQDFKQTCDIDMEDVDRNAKLLEQVLSNFNINAKVMDAIVGPTVTKYELEMPQGIQVKRVEGYSKDISMYLESPSEVIIEAPIPGKNRVGIEVPNKIKQVVSLKEVVQSSEFITSKSKTVFALGKDVTGKNILCDIKEMPHLLIAGATGMGKSVCLNTLIMSLIYHSDPSDLRMLLIDPKKVEFISYKGIPHLLINEIISDNDKAILALQWAIDEMEKRYTMFESVKQRDMDSYNAHILSKGGRKLPRIVIVVDEVADLMSVNKKEIEGKIQRLTQKARAAGIHLVLATQRPSVDVITGVIKTNLPSRIACKLSNGIDSKTVIDEGGAERLLGRGDMFYRPASWPAKVRVQGCFVSTPEVEKVIEFVVDHNTCEYDDICYNAIFNANKKTTDYQNGGDSDDYEVDEYFKDAVRHVIQTNNVTITAIQRRFGLGFPRAGKIFDAMVSRGYVADTMTGKTREILIDAQGFETEFGEPL